MTQINHTIIVNNLYDEFDNYYHCQSKSFIFTSYYNMYSNFVTYNEIVLQYLFIEDVCHKFKSSSTLGPLSHSWPPQLLGVWLSSCYTDQFWTNSGEIFWALGPQNWNLLLFGANCWTKLTAIAVSFILG